MLLYDKLGLGSIIFREGCAFIARNRLLCEVAIKDETSLKSDAFTIGRNEICVAIVARERSLFACGAESGWSAEASVVYMLEVQLRIVYQA